MFDKWLTDIFSLDELANKKAEQLVNEFLDFDSDEQIEKRKQYMSELEFKISKWIQQMFFLHSYSMIQCLKIHELYSIHGDLYEPSVKRARMEFVEIKSEMVRITEEIQNEIKKIERGNL